MQGSWLFASQRMRWEVEKHPNQSRINISAREKERRASDADSNIEWSRRSLIGAIRSARQLPFRNCLSRVPPPHLFSSATGFLPIMYEVIIPPPPHASSIIISTFFFFSLWLRRLLSSPLPPFFLLFFSWSLFFFVFVPDRKPSFRISETHDYWRFHSYACRTRRLQRCVRVPRYYATSYK